jgi:hypothetical protein
MMAALDALGVNDLRPRLSVKPSNSRRARRRPVTSLTLHYNGPRVSGFGNVDRELRQIVDINVPSQQQRLGADSLMYHLCVLSDGSIHQTRDYELQAWHCRNSVGNDQSLAIHLPLGGTQDATSAQWQATVNLFDALIRDFSLSGPDAVKGHLEWAASECPGPFLMTRLRRYRRGEADTGARTGEGMYRIRPDVSAALVREAPTRQSEIRGRMWPGDRLDAEAVVQGESIDGEDRWLQRRDRWGYVHRSLVRPA